MVGEVLVCLSGGYLDGVVRPKCVLALGILYDLLVYRGIFLCYGFSRARLCSLVSCVGALQHICCLCLESWILCQKSDEKMKRSSRLERAQRIARGARLMMVAITHYLCSMG